MNRLLVLALLLALLVLGERVALADDDGPMNTDSNLAAGIILPLHLLANGIPTAGLLLEGEGASRLGWPIAGVISGGAMLIMDSAILASQMSDAQTTNLMVLSGTMLVWDVILTGMSIHALTSRLDKGVSDTIEVLGKVSVVPLEEGGMVAVGGTF